MPQRPELPKYYRKEPGLVPGYFLFTIELPRDCQFVCYTMSMPASNPPVVLVVEDYPAGMVVSTLMIEHLGYAVETASCGKEAIEKVRAATAPFMAIMMDVKMRDMDGFAVTKAIRKLEREKGYSNTIIAVTAHALAGDRERCLKAGMNDYISKPIHPDILAQKLAALAQAQDTAKV
jgi:CheY-like chemotaxis protein